VYGVFADGDETFKSGIRIYDPNDKVLTGDIVVGDSIKKPDASLQLAINFKFFHFPIPGDYKIEILLNDRVYANQISIRPADQSLP
jgi:hypothetical protein